jgi:acetyltransferase-like isoleucine patch superfamily enzyme
MGMSLVGANCEISSHCFLGARSTIGGGSRIGEQTFVGMNCTVFDQTTVGRKCILGACTAVKRDVPDFSLYKTSSDIVMMQYSENEIENKLLFKRNVR